MKTTTLLMVCLCAAGCVSGTAIFEHGKPSWYDATHVGQDLMLAPDYQGSANEISPRFEEQAISRLLKEKAIPLTMAEATAMVNGGIDRHSPGGRYYLLRAVRYVRSGGFGVYQKNGRTLVLFGTMGYEAKLVNCAVVAWLPRTPVNQYADASTDL